MARGDRFRKILPWLLMNDEKFLRKYGDMVRPAELAGDDAEYEWILRFASEFWEKYHAVPSYEALGEAFETMPVYQQDRIDGPTVVSILDIDPPSEGTLEWARDIGGDWIKNRNALVATEAMANSLQEGDLESFVKYIDNVWRFQKATSTESELTGDISLAGWKQTLKDIFAEGYREGAIGIGVAEIDELMGGGIIPGELAALLGATNTGKSQLLTAFARCAFLQGYSVLYISLENSFKKTNEIFLAGLVQMTPKQMNARQDVVESKLLRVMNKEGMEEARFKTVYWPSRSKGVADIELFLDKEADLGHTYDIIFVDYGDLLKPARLNRNNEYMEQGEIFNDLRAMAIDRQLRVWSATQANRDAVDKAIVKLSNMGNSYEKAKHPDWVVAIGQSADQKRDHIFSLFLAKARDSAIQEEPSMFESRWEVNSFDPL